MKKLLTMMVAVLFGCPLFGALTDGLVAHYKFDGNANDSSGNGNNGVVHGATLATDRFGNPNSAYSFDGVDDWIQVPNSTSLQGITTGYSVCAWCRMDRLDSLYYAINLASKMPDSWRVQIYSDHAQAGNVGGIEYDSGSFSVGEWVYVAACVDETGIRLYKNGVEIASGGTVSKTVASSGDLFIGNDPYLSEEFSAGAFDDLRIYNRVLSAAEVKALYDGDGAPVMMKCAVTFDAAGGTAGWTKSEVVKGAAVGTLPTATRSGYKLDGWYTAKTGGTKVTAATVIMADVTYYAHWTQNITYYTVTFNANGGSCSTSSKQYTSGATLGSLPTATRSGYTFGGWYTSSSGGSKVSSSTAVTKNVTYYAHWKAGSGKSDPVPGKVYVGVAVDADCIRMGTVSGGNKLFKIGAKASLSAKAAKGYVFAGWFDESGDTLKTVSGDFRKASDSFVVERETEIRAYFVPKADDDYIWIDIPDEWVVEKDSVDGNYAACDFWIDSYSFPTVTVKGLPSGCKYDKVHSRLVFAKQPSKPGVSKVTITVKNASGVKIDKVIYVRVPNLRSDVFEYLDYDSDYHATCGVSDACVRWWCAFDVAPGWTVKASGLPSGLKFDSASKRLYGTPTKPGTYTITFTATKKGYDAQKATITFVVDPLPNEAIGKFNGLLYSNEYDGHCIGSFTMTATAAGKLSATLVMADGKKKSYSAKSWNCAEDGVYIAEFYKAAAKGSCAKDGERVYIELDTGAAWDDYQLWGSFSVDPCSRSGEGEISAQRNPFGKVGKNYENMEAHSIASKLAGLGKMGAFVFNYDFDADVYELVCPNCTVHGNNKPDLTFTAKVDGTIKVSGKLQGKSISGSSTVQIVEGEDPFADFYLIVNKEPVHIHVDLHWSLGADGAVMGFLRSAAFLR